MRAARVVVIAIVAFAGASVACGSLLGIGDDDDIPAAAPAVADAATPDDGDTIVVLDSGFAKDSATDAAPDVSARKIVFVSSTTTLPAFDGGADGANAFCDALAVAAGMTGRSFVAYLYLPGLLGGVYAPELLSPEDGWFLVNGTRAFSASTVGTGSDPLTPLVVDERGRVVDVSARVWTGTPKTLLLLGGKTCSDWTSTSGDVLTGNALVRSDWRDDGERPCNEKRHLYCFEK